MVNLPKLEELDIGNIRYKIGIDRATEKQYGGIKAKLLPKDNESEAIEVFIGRDGKLYIPAKSLDDAIETEKTIEEYDSYLKFPTVGKDKTLYVDTSKNKVYRFSESDLKYYSVSGITEDELNDKIQIINGNPKNF